MASELLIARGLSEGTVVLVLDQLEQVFGSTEKSETRATVIRIYYIYLRQKFFLAFAVITKWRTPPWTSIL
jgi:hypothetical protein